MRLYGRRSGRSGTSEGDTATNDKHRCSNPEGEADVRSRCSSLPNESSRSGATLAPAADEPTGSQGSPVRQRLNRANASVKRQERNPQTLVICPHFFPQNCFAYCGKGQSAVNLQHHRQARSAQTFAVQIRDSHGGVRGLRQRLTVGIARQPQPPQEDSVGERLNDARIYARVVLMLDTR
jgi:hypothetical protein